MDELSLHLLDIAQNALRAGATRLRIAIEEGEGRIRMTVADNGCGMSPQILARATEPYFSTKGISGAGLGLFLLLQVAERTGGSLHLASRDKDQYPEGHGTEVTAEFVSTHADCPPMGDTVATVLALLQASPETDLQFSHTIASHCVSLNTEDMRAVLGEGIPLGTPEVLHWTREFLTEQYQKEKHIS